MHGNGAQRHSSDMAHAPLTACHSHAIFAWDAAKSLPVRILSHHCYRCAACSQVPCEEGCAPGGLAPGSTTGSGCLLVQQPGDKSQAH